MVVNTPCSVSVPRPDLDLAREDMVDRVQRQHNERVSDHSYIPPSLPSCLGGLVS